MWKRYFIDLIQFNKIFFIQFWRNFTGQKKGKLLIESRRAEKYFKDKAIYQEIILTGPITINERSIVQGEIEKSMHSQSTEHGFSGVLLNMSGVTFIDSSGMGMLVTISKQARQAGKNLVLSNLKPEIQTTLRLIKLDQFLTIMTHEESREPLVSPIEIRYAGDWCIIPVDNRLETRAVKAFSDQVELLNANHNQFIADFAHTTFIDSSGIAMLLRVNVKLREKSGELVLVSIQKDVRRVLELSGVAKRFNIYNTVEEAIQAKSNLPTGITNQERK
jgi:anti-anti-sigma factor